MVKHYCYDCGDDFDVPLSPRFAACPGCGSGNTYAAVLRRRNPYLMAAWDLWLPLTATGLYVAGLVGYVIFLAVTGPVPPATEAAAPAPVTCIDR